MAEDVSKQAEGKAKDLGEQAHSTAEDASKNLQGKAKWVDIQPPLFKSSVYALLSGECKAC